MRQTDPAHPARPPRSSDPPPRDRGRGARSPSRAGFPAPAATLPEALLRAAEELPERGVAIFDSRGRRAQRRTFAEVLTAARRTAGRLAGLGVEPGDRVLVSLSTSWDWFETWFGALLLGAWPAALAPSGPMGSAAAHLTKLEGLLEDLGARHVCCSAAFREEAARAGASRTATAAITAEALAAAAPRALPELRTDPEAVAYLQLTSGSTGRPRAVMVTHRGVLANVLAIDEAIGAPFGAPASRWVDAMVSWLPLHHDMGLVGCVFHALVGGFDLQLLPARTFLARPRLWLESLSRPDATICPAPNFGYQLCTERLAGEDLEGLDLSGWRAAMVGAEMIRPETMEAFRRTFEPQGLALGTLRACYGLAEATLAVTVDRRRDGIRTAPMPRGEEAGLPAQAVASVGSPVAGTEVRVVGPDGAPLPEGKVGEVGVRGASVTPGYFNDPEATAESLDGDWLRTGDLGFLAGGELYLTGRLKDLLIIRGDNVMPHELEWLAEREVGGGGSARCGAFSITRGAQGEEAVLVVEADGGDPDALAHQERRVRVALGRELSLPLADLVFVRRGQIPKTTSGKVQRGELRRRYLAGELPRLEAP